MSQNDYPEVSAITKTLAEYFRSKESLQLSLQVVTMLRRMFEHYPNMGEPTPAKLASMAVSWTEDLMEESVTAEILPTLYKAARKAKTDGFMPSLKDILDQWELWCDAHESHLQVTFHVRNKLKNPDDEAAAIRAFQESERNRRESQEAFIAECDAELEQLRTLKMLPPQGANVTNGA